MKIIGFGLNAVTIELDPGECFALAEACRETIAHDAGTDQPLTDLLESTLTLAAMAAATWDATSGSQGMTIEQVRACWLRRI